ncbi:MAG TPA: L-2-amino-thiazoline-4-carboxylic acid hydrolase [Bacillota bacterium]|jgi:predicted ArsR family transcriptional regulator|nr:L-2-amino-thiazoline-4-carboxylic acid hydrolase [Bacillota bacterium]HOL09029.1 L-2-amino-thiazoline-4-carboxylic acid hydrolase [Bacillota bacterium]HPO96704.1 L-2-amino-thiazoline-4-carboxylic acid hydrolase [Bacillota bacterium]
MMNQTNNTPESLIQRITWLNRYHTQDKVDLFNAFRESFGPKVAEVFEQVEAEKAHREWSNIAIQTGKNSIEDLISLLWEPLRAKGFEFTYEIKPDGVQFKCTKCPIYDLAIEINATEWLYHHTCCSDPHIVEGFNPKIGLRRTKTLMQGADCCDHFYFIKE